MSLGRASTGSDAGPGPVHRTPALEDPWAPWLLHRRYGGDEIRHRAQLHHLHAVRDRVLDNAAVGEGNVVVDVGCGDGLLGFAALPRAGETGWVIFSDVSQDMLDHCRSRAGALGVLERCQFLRAPASDLGAIPSGSADVVATRSVVIYVGDKPRAFREFHRVLGRGGRLSIFEPVARFFGYPPAPHLFGWQTLYDVTPIMEIAGKVQAVYSRVRSAASPMMDFDERDLVRFAEAAGFSDIALQMHVDVRPARPVKNWEAKWRSAPNPLAPTLAEAVDEALTREEAGRFVSHLRPLMERGAGQRRSAVAYLRAVK
jgi:arsenite methyltransferase